MTAGTEPGAVTLQRASATDAALLQNLMQLYTHDFSGFWAGSSRGEVDRDGRFPAYPLKDYWSRKPWSAQLIHSGAALAGFLLINDLTHLEPAAQRNVGEFFILRKHRGRGVGRSAALQAFTQHPGSWEVAVTRKNLPAQDFWRKTILGAREASAVQESDLQSDAWNGLVMRFDWRAPVAQFKHCKPP